MPKFALKKFEAIVGKQTFFDLLIDGVSQYESFCTEIKGNKQYEAEVRNLFTYMDYVSSLKPPHLPKTKFRDLTPKKGSAKEYEFKSKHLRAYVFHEEKTGKVVAVWGYKKTQDEDIKRFRSIKKQYLNSL